MKFEKRVETDENDGSYTMYILPGQYDVILERPGFMAEVVTEITVNQGDIIDLGHKTLATGDTHRDGIISAMDLVEVINLMDSSVGDGVYEERCDLGQKGFISAMDLVSIIENMDLLINIEKYM